jgi:hypothetical protein
MQSKRTQAWWWVRLELLAGICLTVLIGLRGLDWALETLEPTFGKPLPLGPLGLPLGVFGMITALVIAVVGLIWMVRIFRGPGDEPPPWRYRDR